MSIKPEVTHCANCGAAVPVDEPHKVGECGVPADRGGVVNEDTETPRHHMHGNVVMNDHSCIGLHPPRQRVYVLTPEEMTARVQAARADDAELIAEIARQGQEIVRLGALAPRVQAALTICDQVEANPVGWGGDMAVSLARTIRAALRTPDAAPEEES